MQLHPSFTAHLAVTGHLRVYILRMHEVLCTISEDNGRNSVRPPSATNDIARQSYIVFSFLDDIYLRI